MVPTLRIGDIVIYKKVDAVYINAVPNDGDIIVIRGPSYFYKNGFPPILWENLNNNTPIVHRAIRKVFNYSDGLYYFETKGDNNKISDGCIKGNLVDGYGIFIFNTSDPILIPETEVLGKVVIIIPFLGNLGLYFNKILIVMIIIILVILILDNLKIKIKIEKKR